MPSSKRTPEELTPPAYEPAPAHKPTAINAAMDDACAIRDATRGFKNDKKALIRIIPTMSLDSDRMALLRENYMQLYHRGPEDDIGGYGPLQTFFTDVILGMINGQVWMDVEHLHKINPGWSEGLINQSFGEIIFYRPQAKLQAIKEMYDQKHSSSLTDFVKLRCKGGAEHLFTRCLETVRCEDGTDALDTQRIRVDVQQLHQGLWEQGKSTSTALDILAQSSREKIIAIMDEFGEKYKISLVNYIKEKVTGGFQITLIHLLEWSEDPVQYSRDVLAKLWHIKHSTVYLLVVIHTMVWAHWNRALFESGKMRLRYTGSDLKAHLKGALHKDSFEDLLLKIHDGKY